MNLIMYAKLWLVMACRFAVCVDCAKTHKVEHKLDALENLLRTELSLVNMKLDEAMEYFRTKDINYGQTLTGNESEIMQKELDKLRAEIKLLSDKAEENKIDSAEVKAVLARLKRGIEEEKITKKANANAVTESLLAMQNNLQTSLTEIKSNQIEIQKNQEKFEQTINNIVSNQETLFKKLEDISEKECLSRELTTITAATKSTITTTMATTEPVSMTVRDCSDLRGSRQQNGSYMIYPYGSSGRAVSVYCEFNSDGVWTVIQRRLDGSVKFTRNWMEYKNGFGSSSGEYWIGNEILYRLTSQRDYRLKIVLTDWTDTTKFARYRSFRVSDEWDKYRLSIGGYSGNAGDSMTEDGASRVNYVHNGMQFSTYDSDNDKWPGGNCAALVRAGWWYNSCYGANLNGIYNDTPIFTYSRGIIWYQWHGKYYSLKQTTMIIQKK